MSNPDVDLIKKEEEHKNEMLKSAPAGEKQTVPDTSNPLQKAIDEMVKKEAERLVKASLNKPQIIKFDGKPEVTVTFPDIQKVSGAVKILNTLKTQLIGPIIAKVDFPKIQKITGEVAAKVNFPDVQKIKGEVDAKVEFPDVQKIKGEVDTNIPVVELGGKKMRVIPVTFFDGQRMGNPMHQQVASNGRLANVMQDVLNRLSNFRWDSFNFLKTAEQYVPGAEDNTNGVYKVEERFSYARATADAQIKASAGFVHTVTFIPTGTVTPGVITLYDNTAESGTPVFSGMMSDGMPIQPVTLDVVMGTGIYVGYDPNVGKVLTVVAYR